MTRISNETSKIFKDPSYISKKLGDLKKKKNWEDLFPTRGFLHHPFTRQSTDIETMGPVLSRASTSTKVSDG